MDGRGIVIPRSQTPEHQQQNLDVLALTLTKADIASLSSLPQNKGKTRQATRSRA